LALPRVRRKWTGGFKSSPGPRDAGDPDLSGIGIEPPDRGLPAVEEFELNHHEHPPRNQ